jgi:hypothetical protein
MRAFLATVLAGVAAAVAAAVLGSPGVAFDAHASDRLVLTTPVYRLAIAKRNGKLLELVDRASGTSLLHGGSGCLWSATRISGCSTRQVVYRWRAATATLTLRYDSPGFGTVVVSLTARPSSVDLRLTLRNRSRLRTTVRFPDGLVGDAAAVTAGYAPNVLPGVRLKPAFFSRVGNDVENYPSRWAFADYLALDVGSAHAALYSVSTGPIRPVNLGFAHFASGSCSGGTFCLVHEFQTWIRPGRTWTSPLVRLRVGGDARQSILAYRSDNGIDGYPSLQSKLGPRLTTLAQAPLVKANLARLPPFRDWAAELGDLPSPVLLHPVGYQIGGFDQRDPDFLPPDPRYGTLADFAAMVSAAHLHGDLVMPYDNVSWWDPASPTAQSVVAKDVAVLDQHGQPESVAYGAHTGIIVSPYAAAVRARVAQELEAWRSQVPADCVFFDQIGARPWYRDFNPASPTTESYDDGWLALLAPYAGRCLMVEDGWDRLARDFVGFHGSALMMSRELDLPNTLYGAGNWAPYPLATWLFHDKVLLYQHDLYDGTMATDGEVLMWNMAFGLVSTVSWDETHGPRDPWLELASQLQRALGPHYAGVPLASYRNLSDDVTESVFGDLTIDANWSSDAAHDGVAPHGFAARTQDGSVVAGSFVGSYDGVALTDGTHYLLVRRDATSVTVRQPVGADTDVGVAAPSAVRATAIADDGSVVGTVPGAQQGGRFVFRYARSLNGHPVAAYRVGA